MPSAIQCSQYLADARRGIMCAVCDSREFDYFYQMPANQNKQNTFIKFSYSTCMNFLSSCLKAIESKRKLIDFINVEFTLGLCEKDGKYIAEGEKTHYKKLLPSSVMFDDENFQKCKQHLDKDNEDNKSNSDENEKACLLLCRRYFSLTGLFFDDFDNLDYFKYMHDILKEIVNENLYHNLFNIRPYNIESIILDAHDVIYDFESSNSSSSIGVDIDRHVKDNGYKAIKVEDYIKGSFVLAVALAGSILLLLF